MDRQVVMRIVSAALGLGLVGVGAYLLVTESSHGEAVLFAGLAIAGGLGTAGLPRVLEPRRPK